MSARSFWQEFKAFAMKGNMLDLAVAVVIGAAFGQIITSLVGDIIMPAISYITPQMEYTGWKLGTLKIGNFIGAVINFLIVAFAVFIVIVKLVGGMVKKVGSTPAPSEPTTKECPMCLSVIPLKAVKCAHCTADLPAVE
jgi:large conductance mechanosensitive channel